MTIPFVVRPPAPRIFSGTPMELAGASVVIILNTPPYTGVSADGAGAGAGAEEGAGAGAEEGAAGAAVGAGARVAWVGGLSVAEVCAGAGAGAADDAGAVDLVPQLPASTIKTRTIARKTIDILAHFLLIKIHLHSPDYLSHSTACLRCSNIKTDNNASS
jgi:hypothetical protein